MKRLFAAAAVLAGTTLFGGSPAQADPLRYADVGTPNLATYAFTASTTGDVIATFVGSTAGYDNQLGLMVNGVRTSAGFGLDDHTSQAGDTFNLGHVNAGDRLVFVLRDLTIGRDAYSDPSLNLAYDYGNVTFHNHVYSASYTPDPANPGVIPAGTYVAFEDLPFPQSDYNYNDLTFVFNVVDPTVASLPEPGSLALLGLCLAGLGLGLVRRRRSA